MAVRETAEHVTCSTIADDVVDLRRRPGGGFVLRLACSSEIEVDQVALCIGNFPPARPGGVSERRRQPLLHRRSVGRTGSRVIPQDAPLLIMGTGLTTADLLISLNRNGHRGPVTALSRRGLLPSIHQEARSYPSYIEHYTGEGAEPPTTAGRCG